jgi:hypothetical protein
MKTEESIIEIAPIEFTLGEFTFTQVKREGMVAIYKQTLSASGTKIAFETVVLKGQLPKTIQIAGKDVNYAHKEVYPSSAQWGRRGWSYVNLQFAEVQMTKVLLQIEQGMKF